MRARRHDLEDVLLRAEMRGSASQQRGLCETVQLTVNHSSDMTRKPCKHTEG